MFEKTLINVEQRLRKEPGFTRGEDVSMFLYVTTIYCIFEKRGELHFSTRWVVWKYLDK